MSDPNLTPQEPGVMPGVNVDALQALADGNVADLVGEIAHLDANELEQLLALERSGKARTTALGAIQREIDTRALPDSGDEPGFERSQLGDTQNYADMAWQDVDQTKLQGPVLTRDGWLHPAPSATPIE